MAPVPEFIAAGQTVQDVAAIADKAPVLMVGESPRLLGVVTPTRLAEAIAAGRGTEPVGAMLEGEVIHAHPDHGSEVVLERLGETNGMLPVVSRDDAQHLVGVVTIADVIRFLGKRKGTVARSP